MFNDKEDPYQMHNIDYKDNPELFNSLCDTLAVKLEEARDVWHREQILEKALKSAHFFGN